MRGGSLTADGVRQVAGAVKRYREKAMSLKCVLMTLVLSIGLIGLAEAQSSPVDSKYTITIYQTTGATLTNAQGKADTNNPALRGTALAIVTYDGLLNFDLGRTKIGPNTIGGFLATGTGTLSGLDSTTAGRLLSGGPSNLATVLDITFSAGAISGGSIEHDDGVSLYQGARTLLSSPAPTSPRFNNFSSSTGGSYRLIYVAGFGLPEVLIMTGMVQPDFVDFSCSIDLTQSTVDPDFRTLLPARASNKFCPANNKGVLKLTCSGQLPDNYNGGVISDVNRPSVVCRISGSQCGLDGEFTANATSIQVSAAGSVELVCEAVPQ
jgi:hypothetical protein